MSFKFGIVDHQVCTDPNLSIQAKGLYSILCCYANKDRLCWPSINILANNTNSSQTSIKRWIRELKSQNYIKRIGFKIKIL